MANRIQDAFGHVKADEQMKESARQYLSVQRKKWNRQIGNPFFSKAFAAVCAVFLLVSGIGGYSWILAPVSYISIDVNPSVELALNRLDRVVSAKAYNAQGKELLKGVDIKGKQYTEAVSAVAGSEVMQKYLTGEEELVFTVAADSSREQELTAGVEKACSHTGYNCQSVSADLDSVLEAHDHGMSIGKYHAYQILSQYDDTVTVYECGEMSMSEIHRQIQEHEHSSTHGHGGSDGGDFSENETDAENEDFSENKTDAESEAHSQHEHHHGGGHGE